MIESLAQLRRVVNSSVPGNESLLLRHQLQQFSGEIAIGLKFDAVVTFSRGCKSVVPIYAIVFEGINDAAAEVIA